MLWPLYLMGETGPPFGKIFTSLAKHVTYAMPAPSSQPPVPRSLLQQLQDLAEVELRLPPEEAQAIALSVLQVVQTRLGSRPRPESPRWRVGAIRFLNAALRARAAQARDARQTGQDSRDCSLWERVAELSQLDQAIAREDAELLERKRQIVRQAFSKLPPRTRRILQRVFYDNQSIRKLAEELGVSPATAHQQLMDAIAELHDAYQALLMTPPRIDPQSDRRQ